jgi:xanthine dehydrogenase accessory factor
MATLYDTWRDAVADQRPVVLATVIEGPGTGAKILVGEGVAPMGTLGDPDLDRVVVRDALGELESGRTGVRHYGPHGEAREHTVAVFVESFAPPPQMLVFGAVDFTGALVKVAKLLGYRVTVCDAREVFATARRFPDADEVVVEWPHRYLAATEVDARTVICVLTHDPKFDVPVLQQALKTDAAYIGVMGSRRTHEDRLARLRAEGVDDADLERLRSPIGLDLGGRTPEETAVSIAAEIVQHRWGGSGRPLSETSGRIHVDQAPATT